MKKHAFTALLLSLAIFFSFGAFGCPEETAKFCEKNYKNPTVANSCKAYCTGIVVARTKGIKPPVSKDRLSELVGACQAGQYGALVLKLSADQGYEKCYEHFVNDPGRVVLCKIGLNRELVRKAAPPSGTGIGGDREGGRETGM